MTEITEYGDVMINAYLDEWGRRRINGLLEDGTRIIVVAVVVVETVVAQDFPRLYLEAPVKAQQLTSKVSGAAIIKVAKDFPEVLLKEDRAKELRSKFS